MELIDQAVFLSAEGDCCEDARRIVVSEGVREADALEILAWGPTSDEVLGSDGGASGIYGHRLRSGAYVLGRTTLFGGPLGTRNGLRASTQCLILRPRTLARFAGNPFALLHGAEAAGVLRSHEELPTRLEPLAFGGRAGIVDAALLSQLCLRPGVDWMAALVQAAIDSASTGVVEGTDPEGVFAGVLNCLPPECRMGISFSIGLRFCARRPYRLVAVPNEAGELERIRRLYHVTVLDLSDQAPSLVAPAGSWGSVIQRVLRSGRTSFFAGQLARRPLDFSPQDLPALALQMLEEMDASATAGEEEEGGWPAARESTEPFLAQGEAGDDECEADLWMASPDEAAPPLRQNRRRAHAPHSPGPFGGEIPPAAVIRPRPPSKDLDPDSPEVLHALERLDDLVFDSVSGNQASLEELKTVWPGVRDELGDDLLAESRAQYLRYALTSWEKLAHREAVRDPALAMQSLEVLCVLFTGAID